MAIYSYLESLSPSRIAAKSAIFPSAPSPKNLASGHKNQMDGYRWLSRSNLQTTTTLFLPNRTDPVVYLPLSSEVKQLFRFFFSSFPLLDIGPAAHYETTINRSFNWRPFRGLLSEWRNSIIAFTLVSCRCKNGPSLAVTGRLIRWSKEKSRVPKSLPHFSLESFVEKGANGKRKLARRKIHPTKRATNETLSPRFHFFVEFLFAT